MLVYKIKRRSLSKYCTIFSLYVAPKLKTTTHSNTCEIENTTYRERIQRQRKEAQFSHGCGELALSWGLTWGKVN